MSVSITNQKKVSILHASDLHGQLEVLGNNTHLFKDIDIVVLSGDMFPNFSFHGSGRKEEPHKQRQWFKTNEACQRFLQFIEEKNLPVVFVDGNHDFASMGDCIPNAVELGRGTIKEVKGIKFAGFSNIPQINGMWNHETDPNTLESISKELLTLGPFDVLVTHAPPGGILDGVPYRNMDGTVGEMSCGIPTIGAIVTATPTKAQWKYHLFGHIHEYGGHVKEVNGVVHRNGATKVSLLTLSK